jgi:hypothetical protein
VAHVYGPEEMGAHTPANSSFFINLATAGKVGRWQCIVTKTFHSTLVDIFVALVLFFGDYFLMDILSWTSISSQLPVIPSPEWTFSVGTWTVPSH